MAINIRRGQDTNRHMLTCQVPPFRLSSSFSDLFANECQNPALNFTSGISRL